MKPRNAREPDREKFMIMRPFHLLLKDATKDIRESRRRISPTNLFKVIVLGENGIVSDLTPPDPTNSCTIAVFNGRYINNCNLEHQAIIDADANSLLPQFGKGISVLV